MSRRGSIATPGGFYVPDAPSILCGRKRTRPAVATVKPRPTVTSLAERRVTTSDMARPTTAPTARAANVARLNCRLCRDDHRYERAGQHHGFEAEIDEAADAVNEAADGGQQDGLVITSAAWRKAAITACSAGGSR